MPTPLPAIGIVTTTYYPDANDPVQQVRARLAATAITNAASMGFTVTVVDSGSHQSLIQLDELSAAGARVVRNDNPNMAYTRELAVSIALEAPIIPSHIVWTEPEKDITPWAQAWVERANREGASVVIPMRTNMTSYPIFQQISERTGNDELADIFGVEFGDHYFGPRVFRYGAAEDHWLNLEGEHPTLKSGHDWASIFIPVWRALAAGERVIGVPVDFHYPITQSAVENQRPEVIEKRKLQRSIITESARDALANLLWRSRIDLRILDGFKLRAQLMSPIDLRDPQIAEAS